MLANLYGNPHSASSASQLTTRKMEDVRLRALRFFDAEPEDFDLVFVANATAGVKLVMEAFRESKAEGVPEGVNKGFWYGYHRDSHTSLVGVREEAAAGQKCFQSDEDVGEWLSTEGRGDLDGRPILFAYPAQSNLNGRRLPLEWCNRLRASKHNAYSLLDAAAYVSTSPFSLADAAAAPDFTVVSFYKIFGFPDLGALIVRKGAGYIFARRKYFGGGTVEMVSSEQDQWHIMKQRTIHEQLEDGTLPFHSILALGIALDVHGQLYGSMAEISQHTGRLSRDLYEQLASLHHGNGVPVCEIYKEATSSYGDSKTQGPILALNLRTAQRAWVSNAEFEKLANIKKINVRTGGVCNPGGVASCLNLASWEMKQNYSAGQRCGHEIDIINGKPTGVIRISLGAVSTTQDVRAFVDFIKEFYVEQARVVPEPSIMSPPRLRPRFHVESLTIYPIKSCGGWKIPCGQRWEVREEGLAWDREWCLVHLGTGKALSLKRHTRMALLRPSIDLDEGFLRVKLYGTIMGPLKTKEITIPLKAAPESYRNENSLHQGPSSQVCGENIKTFVYASSEVSDFFTAALDVPCTLARFPAGGSGQSIRHSKAHLQKHQVSQQAMPMLSTPPSQACPFPQRPILLSNESPILVICRSSLNRLNEQIKATGGKAAQAEVFRANIIIAEDHGLPPGSEQPYIEDRWRHLQVGQHFFQMLGSCRRCQMVCVDPNTTERDQEPFVTLSKTRRYDGKVWFGQHTCLVSRGERNADLQPPTIKTGDEVKPFDDAITFEDTNPLPNV